MLTAFAETMPILTKDKVVKYVHAIVSTLDEVGTDAAESTFYMALGMNLQLWNALRDLLVGSDLISVRSHRVSLTVKGSQLAKQCKAIVR